MRTLLDSPVGKSGAAALHHRMKTGCFLIIDATFSSPNPEFPAIRPPGFTAWENGNLIYKPRPSLDRLKSGLKSMHWNRITCPIWGFRNKNWIFNKSGHLFRIPSVVSLSGNWHFCSLVTTTGFIHCWVVYYSPHISSLMIIRKKARSLVITK